MSDINKIYTSIINNKITKSYDTISNICQYTCRVNYQIIVTTHG